LISACGIARALRDTAGPSAVEEFGRAVVANYLLGAPDAYAKNCSVMSAASGVQFAALCDVASRLTSARDGQLRYPGGAMSVGGERAFGECVAATGTVSRPHSGCQLTRFGAGCSASPAWRRTHCPTRSAGYLRGCGPGPALPLRTAPVRMFRELTLKDLDDMSAGRRLGPSGSENLAGVRLDLVRTRVLCVHWPRR